MPLPLIPILLGSAIGGSLVSGGASLYSQYRQRQLWGQQANAYMNLHNGYNQYLAKHGRSINPDKAWLSYYGQAKSLQNAIDTSYASSVGTIGRTASITAGMGAGLYRNIGRTSRRL